MWLGLSALLLANFIGGAINPFLVKAGVKEIPPLTFTFFRYLVAILTILPFYLHNKPSISKKDLYYLFVNGIFFFLNVSLFSIAIQYTTVIMSQIIYTALPIVVAFFGYFIIKEKITTQKIIGLVIAIIGVFILLEQSTIKGQSMTFGTPLGNILTLCAMSSWAMYFVLSKKLTHKYQPETISFYNFLATVILLLFVIPIELIIRPFVFSNVTAVGIESFVILGVISSALMIYLVQYGIKKTSAFSGSLFQYTGPFFASIIAIPFLGEKPTFMLIFGGALILLGVFYATTFQYIKKYLRF